MTFFTKRMTNISEEEWIEMVALNDAIHYNPASVSPEKMEFFTELFVRTLEGKGDVEINNVTNSYNSMSDIHSHIQKDKEILDNPTISPQMRRHTADELSALETYQENHPDDTHDPSPLELYCDSHPDALECRVYGD